jgi:hypothetical protein
MVRKRKPGGGRKPDPYKKVMFSTRLEPEVMAAIKTAAETWPGKNVSTFVEALIVEGLRERKNAQRDPALRALLHLIGNLAARISGEAYIVEPSPGADTETEWRTDLFAFRTFKFAVRQLLDALEEPPGDLVGPVSEEALNEFGGSPELKSFLLETSRTPENYGAYIFAQLWSLANRATPLTAKGRELMREYPRTGAVWMDDFYGLPQARRDLQLKKGD